jgi:hypothetical protein
MSLIWGVEQCYQPAAEWHDGQIAHGAHARGSIRSAPFFQSGFHSRGNSADCRLFIRSMATWAWPAAFQPLVHAPVRRSAVPVSRVVAGTVFALMMLLFAAAGEGRAQSILAQDNLSRGNLCGLSPTDWCTTPGDPCNRHPTAESCKRDRQCYGIAYRGESVVACLDDGERRGFSSNCPTVGCTSAPPRQPRQDR